MSDWNKVMEAACRGALRWRAVLVIMVGAVVLLCFTGVPGKVKRGLKEIFTGDPVRIQTDETDIRRQIESRLRSEMEDELQRELDAVRREADRKIAQIEEEYRSKPIQLPMGSVTDVRKLRSGIPFVTEVTFEPGRVASQERIDDQSYTASYHLRLRMPGAAKSLGELAMVNPAIPKMFPAAAGWFNQAEVSPWYYRLYENKVERIRREANTLNEVLTKHNLYDCETILNFTAGNGRKVFLMQADMDVVSDGSDGDRLASMPDAIVNSSNYQPFTSYGWPKRSATPNPMIEGWKGRIEAARKEAADPTTSRDRKAWLKDRIDYLKRGIEDMKSRSFLVAEYDPFIVIPVNLLGSRDSFAPKVGDYGVVVYGDKLYPVIVGDGGPTFKVGEASLRIARELNPNASPYSRPVSDLKVTYLVFPGSRDEVKGPPNYVRWRDRCAELLAEVGGLGEGYELHLWQDLMPPPIPEPPTVPLPASDESAPAAVPPAPVPAGTGR